MTETLLFTFNIVTPIFAMVCLGWGLRVFKIIKPEFIPEITKLVYFVALPCLIFFKTLQSKVGLQETLALGLIFNIGTFTLCLLAWWISKALKLELKSRASFTQSIWRSNIAIFAFPILDALFPNEGLSIGVIVLAWVLPLFMLMAIILLTLHHSNPSQHPFWGVLSKLIKNPLILSYLLALIFRSFEWGVPSWIEESGNTLGEIALPLGLLAIGSSLDLKALKLDRTLLLAVFLKNIFTPGFLTTCAWLWGLPLKYCAMTCIISGAPSAIAGYIMAEALGSDARLAARIVVLSTLCSIFTSSVAIFLLKHYHWITT